MKQSNQTFGVYEYLKDKLYNIVPKRKKHKMKYTRVSLKHLTRAHGMFKT